MPAYGSSQVKVVREGSIASPDLAPGKTVTLELPKTDADVIQLTAIDPNGQEIFTWSHKHMTKAENLNMNRLRENTQKYTCTEDADLLTVKNGNRQFAFSKQTGLLTSVTVGGKKLTFGNGPRFVAAKRSDRSQDGFYNHDDKEAFQKKT